MGRPISSFSDQEKSSLCEMYVSGHPISEIAQLFAVTGGTVSGIAKQAGLAPRHLRSGRALEGATLDLAALQIEDIDGEPRVVDTVLGAALGYRRDRDIRQLIERVIPLDNLRHRAANSPDTKGRGRPAQEYLLDQTQIAYLITRCSLPRADKYCELIAHVFTAWQTGTLQATNLETAVALQDTAEAVQAAVADVMCDAPVELSDTPASLILASTTRIESTAQTILDKMGPMAAMPGNVLKLIEQHIEQSEQIRDLNLKVEGLTKKRGQFSSDTMKVHALTVRAEFHGRCPSCNKETIMSEDGLFLSKTHKEHFIVSHKSDVKHTWVICHGCHEKKHYRLNNMEFYPIFVAYQIRVDSLLEENKPDLFSVLKPVFKTPKPSKTKH